MSNNYRYEPDKDVQQILRYLDDEIPEAPESWTLDDFADLMDRQKGGYDQVVGKAWM